MGVREQMVKPATAMVSNCAFSLPWCPPVKPRSLSKRRRPERTQQMKSYVYASIFACTLYFVPLANAAPPAQDPELQNARDSANEAFVCVPPPYYSVTCETSGGGSVVATFSTLLDNVILEALQDGGSKEWRVFTGNSSCPTKYDGFFSSVPKGFKLWKSEILDLCTACVNSSDCLRLVP